MAKKKSSAKIVEEPVEEPKEEAIEGQEEDLEAEIMADLEGLDSDTPVTASPEEVVDEGEQPEENEVEAEPESVEEGPEEELGEQSEPVEEPEAPLEEEGEPAADNETVESVEPVEEETVNAEAPAAEAEEELTPPLEGEEEEESEEGELPPVGEAAKLSQEVDEHTRLKNVVEAALFVAGRPLSMEELNTKTSIGKRDLETCLNELMMDYLERPTALEIIQIQDKFSLQIKPEYTSHAKKFTTGGLIPDAILKTLTIVALKQPLLKSTLIKIRGAGAYDQIGRAHV